MTLIEKMEIFSENILWFMCLFFSGVTQRLWHLMNVGSITMKTFVVWNWTRIMLPTRRKQWPGLYPIVEPGMAGWTMPKNFRNTFRLWFNEKYLWEKKSHNLLYFPSRLTFMAPAVQKSVQGHNQTNALVS